MDSCLTILGVHHLTSVKVVFLSVTFRTNVRTVFQLKSS